LNTVLFEVRPWQEVQDETMFALVTGFVTGGVQVWDRTGEPPVQPAGADDTTVRVWVPLAEQALHPEYVNEVQVTGGGTYVHACESTGVPVQPAGVEETTVRAWVLSDWQAPQAL
jgi:hypothetical protein